MSFTIRQTALAAAISFTGQFIPPVWTASPTFGIVSVGSAVTINSGTVIGVPAPVVTYSITVGGVSKLWPYTLQVADAGATVVVTPIATTLGIVVPGVSITTVVPAYSPLYPSMALGQNVSTDSSFSTLRIYNDRARASQFYVTPYTGTALSNANKDATTGLPTTAFCMKVAEGVLAADSTTTGTWQIIYSSVGQATISLQFGGTLLTNTYAGGSGVATVSFTAGGSALVLAFDRGVTDLHVYDPTTYSVWSTGGTPALFSSQVLGVASAFSYMRLMDLASTNNETVPQANNTWTLDAIPWSSRRTPANYFLNYTDGANQGMPLEWQVALLNAANRPGWFNFPELATDDYITNYATYVAQNLSPTLTADFELGNEHWNTGGSFFVYRKAGYAGMTEAIAFQATTTTEWIKSYMGGCRVSTFSSDGTTATVVFTGGAGHGQTVGASAYIPTVKGFNSGYSGFAGTGAMTVVDAFTITYPCTKADTGGTVPAATVLASSGFLALNSAAGIFTGGFINSIYNFSYFWHYRRVYQMAKLVRDAFIAAGRPVSDARPLLAIQAGSGAEAQYAFGGKSIVNFIAAQFSGAKLSDRIKAVACGGYIQLDQGVAAPGFGLTGTRTTPQNTAAVLAQLKQLADVGHGCYSYGVFASWVKREGLELWGYEIGLDTFGAGGQSTTTQAATLAANGDPGIQSIMTEWLQIFVALGFTRVGWYKCGAGSYTDCFNLGQSTTEILPTTPAISQSPKYKGVIAAATPWSSAYTRHVVPCTLSGYDCVGNEAVVTVGGSWPSLGGANLPSSGYTYNGPTGNGETYFVWLESRYAQTSLVTLSGDYTTAGAITISVNPCNGDNSGGGSFALSGVHTNQTLGTCTITLQPGPNYVFISASANQANVFPHSVQFA